MSPQSRFALSASPTDSKPAPRPAIPVPAALLALAAILAGAGAAAAAAPAPPPDCTTAETTVAATDTPRPIHDEATTTSTIAVSDVGGHLLDLDVLTDITHSFNGDLEITLTSPAGTTVTLTTDNGGIFDDVFAGTTWDDDAGDVAAPGPVSDHAFANAVAAAALVPEEALGAFAGEDPNGTWQLDVHDDADGDQGTLRGWSLTLTTSNLAPIAVESSFASTGAPIEIRDHVTIGSTIAVSGAGGYLCDADVVTQIRHSFSTDLDVTLISPAGTAVTLTTDNGGQLDDVFDGTLWDDGAGAARPPGPVTDSAYVNKVTATPLVPEEALAALIGEDPAGTWRLEVHDDANGDRGLLISWGLELSTCSCELREADLGVAAWELTDGTAVTWGIRVENLGPDDATGVVVTAPLDACTVIVGDDCGGLALSPWRWNAGYLAAGESLECRLLVDASACPPGLLHTVATAVANEDDPLADNNSGEAIAGVGAPLEIPTLGRAGTLLLLLGITLGAMILLRRREA